MIFCFFLPFSLLNFLLYTVYTGRDGETERKKDRGWLAGWLMGYSLKNVTSQSRAISQPASHPLSFFLSVSPSLPVYTILFLLFNVPFFVSESLSGYLSFSFCLFTSFCIFFFLHLSSIYVLFSLCLKIFLCLSVYLYI